MTIVQLPPELSGKLDQIDGVATLPHIAAEILVAMRSKDASIRKIAHIIEKDPSITVKILKIANSPLWGSVGRIESVQRALVLLGIRQVSNIVIAVSLYSSFAQFKPNPHFDRSAFWRHSILTAQIARLLSAQLGANFNGEEFVAGLIHDLGKIIMDQHFNEPFRRIVETVRVTQRNQLAVEMEYLGCTHADIGAILLQRWNFPIGIVTALRYHHNPLDVQTHRELTAAVSLANIWARQMEIDDQEAMLQPKEQSDACQMLEQAYPNIKRLTFEDMMSELMNEAEQKGSFGQMIGLT